jgi:hypothetical protein
MIFKIYKQKKMIKKLVDYICLKLLLFFIIAKVTILFKKNAIFNIKYMLTKQTKFFFRKIYSEKKRK